jgi:hypothetical protein
MMEDAGGYDPLAGGLKDRCLSIRLYAQRPNFRVFADDAGLHTRWSSLLVLPQRFTVIGRVPCYWTKGL